MTRPGRHSPTVRILPGLIEAAEADATVGEMTNTLQGVYGQYDGGPEM